MCGFISWNINYFRNWLLKIIIYTFTRHSSFRRRSNWQWRMAKAVSGLMSKGPSLVKGFIDSATPKYHLFVKYAKVELAPPTPADIPQIRSGIQKLLTGFRTGKWKETTVKEAWLNSLVTAEVVFWFFIGECIGKRSIVGYHV